MHYYAWPYEKIIQARHYTMSYTHSRDFLTPFTPLYFWAAFKSAFVFGFESHIYIVYEIN